MGIKNGQGGQGGRGSTPKNKNIFFLDHSILTVDTPLFPKCLKTHIFMRKFCIFYFSMRGVQYVHYIHFQQKRGVLLRFDFFFY